MSEVKKLTPQDFKIRASCVNKIMGKLSGFSASDLAELNELEAKSKGSALTDNQVKELGVLIIQSASEKGLTPAQIKKKEALEVKEKSDPLTEKQRARYEELLKNKDNPLELSQGAKTYVENWVKENIIYLRKKFFGNKYTKKGNENEDDGIEIVAEYYDLGFISKNEIRKFNPWAEGECDIELRKFIIDVKNSFSFDTFPIFETDIFNKDYWSQLQIYMWLYIKRQAILCYVLTDATEEMIDHECNSRKWILGLDEVTKELYDQVKAEMTYSDLDIRTRIKCFKVEYDPEFIERVKLHVDLCRVYAQEVIDNFKLNLKTQREFIN